MARIIKLFFSLAILCAVSIGCSDDNEYSGHVSITFQNVGTDLSVAIKVPNTDGSLYGRTVEGNQITFELLPGYYTAQGYSSDTFYGPVLFQVIAGRTTRIVYNGQNDAIVQNAEDVIVTSEGQ